MSTRTNPTNYRKLSKTIQLSGRYSTLDQPHFSETVKLPALNAITKSIKYNDLSFVTSRDLKKLRKEPEIAEDYAEVATHNILVSIRKKYDNISKTRQAKQQEIHELQGEKEKYAIEKDKYVDEKNNADKKVKKLEEELHRIKNLGEYSEMEKKVMTAMISRIKSDKIVYDQRKYNLQKELASIAKARHLIEKENEINHQQQDRTKKVYTKLSQHFQAEERQRNIHIASMERMIEEKNQLVDYATHREAEMKQIAENALQDKDQKQKKWYKVYLCHKFVEKLLRDKMNREMAKFGTVQLAFKNIKTETGVGDVQNLVSKFLNKEKIYGDLLGKIASNQKQISDLKANNDQFFRLSNNLNSEYSFLSSNRKDHKDLTHEQKQLLAISQKALKQNLFYQKMKVWLNRNHKKFLRMEDKHKEKFAQSDDQIDVLTSFKEYLTQLASNIQKLKDIPQKQQVDVNQTVKSKINTRIKVTSEAEEEQKNNQTNQRDQEDFVDSQREELHKQNQKFMKQLKKKYEQVRKNKIEGQPRKKQASPEKEKQKS